MPWHVSERDHVSNHLVLYAWCAHGCWDGRRMMYPKCIRGLTMQREVQNGPPLSTHWAKPIVYQPIRPSEVDWLIVPNTLDLAHNTPCVARGDDSKFQRQNFHGEGFKTPLIIHMIWFLLDGKVLKIRV